MVLRLIILSLRVTLSVLLGMVVTLLFGRGRIARWMLRGLRLLRRVGRF